MSSPDFVTVDALDRPARGRLRWRRDVRRIIEQGVDGLRLRNNAHAARRAAHHPGHRGSIDISSHLPFEHTSISLWKTYGSAQDLAHKPGGHAMAMKHSVGARTHRVGVFLQVRPLAASGSLGIGEAAFPRLPAANRAGG